MQKLRHDCSQRRNSAADVRNKLQAIANWFGSLSDAALEAAIKDAFNKFDADSSGAIDR